MTTIETTKTTKAGTRTHVAAAVSALMLLQTGAAWSQVASGTANGANSTAVGAGSTANGPDSLAISRGSSAGGIDSIAIGHNATNDTNSQYGVAIGSGARTSDYEGVAVGRGTFATAGSLALGRQAQAGFASSVALGDSTQTFGVNSVAIGPYAEAREEGIAIGDNAGRYGAAGNSYNIGVGASSSLFVTGSENTAVGVGAGSRVDGTGNAAFGSGAGTWVTGNGNVAMGLNAGSGSNGSPVTAYSTVAIGSNSLATQTAGMALGVAASSQAQSAIAMGWGASAGGTASFVAGGRSAGDNAAAANTAPASSGAGATSAVVLGGAYNAAAPGAAVGASATGVNAVAVGGATNTTGAGTVTGASASGRNAIAIGGSDTTAAAGAQAASDDSIALGRGARVNAAAARGLALGANSQATSADDVALGSNSQTTAVQATPGVTLLGTSYTFAGSSPTAALAVGNRQIQGVAAGQLSSTSTDAVNGSQLYATNQALSSLAANVSNGTTGLVQQTGGSPGSGGITVGGSTGGTTVSFTGTDGDRRLSGVANGTATNDAATVGQLSGVTTSLGGGAQVNADGSIQAPSYTLNTVGAGGTAGSATYNNVGAALGSLSDSVGNLNTFANGIAAGGGIKYFRANSTGADALATGTDSIAVGPGSVASGNGAIAQGANALASNTNSIAIGTSAQATGVNSVAIGANAVALNSVAVGAGAQADQGGAAFGDNAVARAAAQGTALGNGAVVQSSRGVALGAGSVADREGMAGQTEAFSGQAVGSTQGAVSVGSGGAERQITHVAGGTQATDAVNVRQLQAVQAGSVQYARRADGSVDTQQVVLGDGRTPSTVSNVAAGVAPTDAVNVQQLNAGLQAQQQFNDARAAQLQDQITTNRQQAAAGVASAMALAGLPQPWSPGRNMASAAVGSYDGEAALAVGLSRIVESGRWVLKAGGTVNSRGKVGASVGAGWQW